MSSTSKLLSSDCEPMGSGLSTETKFLKNFKLRNVPEAKPANPSDPFGLDFLDKEIENIGKKDFPSVLIQGTSLKHYSNNSSNLLHSELISSH